MERVLFKDVLKICGVVAACLFLLACSPKLNWRTVQSPEQHYSALFPGKPEKIHRQATYQDQELKQTLEAIKVDDDIYSISSIQLLPDQAVSAQKILEQLQSNLFERAKSSGGTVITEEAFYQTLDHQRFPTKDYFLLFNAAGKVQQAMRVRWILRPNNAGGIWIYQISVLQTTPNKGEIKTVLSQEEYGNFFNEFYPE